MPPTPSDNPSSVGSLCQRACNHFFWTEVAATVVHVGLAFMLVGYFGLTGATMAFFGLYIWHYILRHVIVRRLSGFRWSAANRRTGLLFLPVMGLVYCGFHWLPFWLATTVGTLAAFWAGIYSMRILARLIAMDRVPPFQTAVASGAANCAFRDHLKPDRS